MRFFLAVISVAVFSAAVCAQTYGGQKIEANNSTPLVADYTGQDQATAILGRCTSSTAMTTGIQGEGGNFGVKGYCNKGASSRYALYGFASGGTTNYGVYGKASGASDPNKNYGGYFVGKTYCTDGAWYSSDERLKKNITKLTTVLDKIKTVEAIRYEYDVSSMDGLSSGQRIGFSAQNLEAVFPECVMDVDIPVFDAKGGVVKDASGQQEKKTYKAVNYNDMIPVLLGAIQEQQKEIEELKSLIKK